MEHPDGEGRMVVITRCPKQHVPADIWQAVRAFDLLDDFGVLPWHGGSMQQTRTFYEAHSFWSAELSEWEREKDKESKRT